MTRRPILYLLASHPLSMAGTTLVTLSGITWLFSLPLHLRSGVANPYTGLLDFVALPIAFFWGCRWFPRVEVLLDKYPRPVPGALESGRLAPSAATCEQCHARTAQAGV